MERPNCLKNHWPQICSLINRFHKKIHRSEPSSILIKIIIFGMYVNIHLKDLSNLSSARNGEKLIAIGAISSDEDSFLSLYLTFSFSLTHTDRQSDGNILLMLLRNFRFRVTRFPVLHYSGFLLLSYVVW